jgi:ABC-type iron transport system FetAB permease component
VIFQVPLRGDILAFRNVNGRVGDALRKLQGTVREEMRKAGTRLQLGETDEKAARQLLAGWRSSAVRALERYLTEY